MQKVFCYLLLSLISLLGVSSVLADVEKSSGQVIHAHAKDLQYGSVLYELYQGHAFEALTALNVAKVRGGITGHNDHPALIEGSLMLAYGMTREAKVLFESLLLSEETVDHDFVSESARNQAWFYLGKVLMLEQDLNGSLEALHHVNANLLKEDEPKLYDEWLYLKALMSTTKSASDTTVVQEQKTKQPLTLAQLTKAQTTYNKTEEFYSWLVERGEITKETAELFSHSKSYIWPAYVLYNQAVESFNDERYDIANNMFQSLVAYISERIVIDAGNSIELLALKEQTLLSLGQLYLFQNDYERALITLKNIKVGSVFSDQALFTYAVTASHLERFGIALQALNTLKDRELFSPWQQQVPYALAYLYEQMGEPELAFEAYSAAVQHYENLSIKLKKDQIDVTEKKVLAALSLQEKHIEQDLLTNQEIVLALGRDHVANDKYGYLHVDPNDFNYAELLATEPFQLSLRDLHELYKLKFSLIRWEDQLNSFDSMMVTRVQLRTQRINETLNVMAVQNSEQWIKQQQAFSLAFERAALTENSRFFMDDDQRDYQSIIQRMTNNLAQLPSGEEKDNFANKLKRMKSYFSWWIEDRYSVNRWASKKELNGLTRAVDTFKQSNETLKKHLRSDDVNQQLLERIKDGRTRLAALKLELDKNLHQASHQLLVLVKDELERQRSETQDYLLYASKAKARLADVLFLNGNDVSDDSSDASDVSDSSDEISTQTDNELYPKERDL
jgi:hypothetical protein